LNNSRLLSEQTRQNLKQGKGSCNEFSEKIFLAVVFAVWWTLACLVWGDSLSDAASKLQLNLPPEYQIAISKAFPGYRILLPSEIILDKEEMGDELYNKVKDSPSLIVGKFNDDNIEDFAALIRNSISHTNIGTMEGKVISKYDFYGGHLVVCYGLDVGQFDCKKLPGIIDEVSLPFNFALNKSDPGKYLCNTLRKLDLRKEPNSFFDAYDVNYGVKMISVLLLRPMS
jgi:hypothetical protein